MSGIPAGGVCAETDPELFYPEKGSGIGTRDAKRICITSCDVREECLEGALERGEPFGVWGGKTEPERRRILGKRAVS